jgi:hypothetical protein
VNVNWRDNSITQADLCFGGFWLPGRLERRSGLSTLLLRGYPPINPGALFKNGLLPTLPRFLSEVTGNEQSCFADAVPFAQTAVGGPLPATADLVPPIPDFAPSEKTQIETGSDLVADDTSGIDIPVIFLGSELG